MKTSLSLHLSICHSKAQSDHIKTRWLLSKRNLNQIKIISKGSRLLAAGEICQTNLFKAISNRFRTPWSSSRIVAQIFRRSYSETWMCCQTPTLQFMRSSHIQMLVNLSRFLTIAMIDHKARELPVKGSIQDWTTAPAATGSNSNPLSIWI